MEEHFFHPHNVGEIKDADGIGKVGNPRCGDIMKVFIKVRDDKIEDIKFKTFGCAAAIATSSVMTDLVKGKTIQEALKVTNKQIVEGLGELPPVKLHCSVLAADALRAAIEDYQKKKDNQKAIHVLKKVIKLAPKTDLAKKAEENIKILFKQNHLRKSKKRNPIQHK